jgi:hypothetical protein
MQCLAGPVIRAGPFVKGEIPLSPPVSYQTTPRASLISGHSHWRMRNVLKKNEAPAAPGPGERTRPHYSWGKSPISSVSSCHFKALAAFRESCRTTNIRSLCFYRRNGQAHASLGLVVFDNLAHRRGESDGARLKILKRLARIRRRAGAKKRPKPGDLLDFGLSKRRPVQAFT